MNFNLQQYLESEYGKSVTDLFTFTGQEPDEVFETKLLKVFEQSKRSLTISDSNSFLAYFYDSGSASGEFMEKNTDNATYEDLFFGAIDVFQKHFALTDRQLPALVPYMSLYLYCDYPDSPFYPILFNCRFNNFIDACKLIGVNTPKELPLQKDIADRCNLYLVLCDCLDEYRESNKISKAELCSLLYGYAPKYFDSIKAEESDLLPSPTRIWFAGASKGDYDQLTTIGTGIWQCNPLTQRGDIVVMYALSPHSHIHSVWRAVQDATFNPFDIYCDRIEVGHIVEVPHISSKELKEDSFTKEIPIIRKNLQGLNGVELTIDQYKYLQKMFKAKDSSFDISVLPQIERAELDLNKPLAIEKDVEENLLIPLLEKLGYSSVRGEDWDRQLAVKLGRNEKYIPDFVFFPREISSHQINAPFIIEAKYDFKNARQLKKDFDQGVSYAHPLRSKLMGICDKEQIRIYRADADGMFFEDTSIVFHDFWGNISADAEVFNRLKKLIGRDVIAKMA